jgi:predicted CXXCH cytochrome family protein
MMCNRMVVVLAGVMLAGFSCSRQDDSVLVADLRARSAQPPAEALACAGCHPSEFADWMGSQHAHANRLISLAEDGAAFASEPRLEHGSWVTSMKVRKGKHVEFQMSFEGQSPERFRAEAVIGITPLRQYLVPFPGGRWQALDVAYDPRSNAWFQVFEGENRQPREWGHWTGRGMTWNVQCAFCHMTGFEKNYRAETDSYASSWKAMGISCAQCHVQVRPVTLDRCAVTGGVDLVSSQRWMDNCASCHARREELFGTFKAGDSFHDHFRLSLPDEPGVFRADGQVREEDFEFASFQMSRMGQKGVTCRDCHQPHSGKLVAPVENNALCLQCHAPPGNRGAIPIDPLAHSFHKPDSPGNRCVECHMPVNVYMARDGRRDHGFIIPDPLLTIEHGIPNACNRCHTDRTPEWADGHTRTWYGEKMERRSRTRARAVARAYAGDETVATQLLALAETEDNSAWRAALVGLLQPWAHEAGVQLFLQRELRHASPLVRSAAVKGWPAGAEAALVDTSALVRVDAALLRREQRAPLPSANFNEVNAYLQNIADQPAGALRQAHLAQVEGRVAEAESWAEKAVAWDPSAVPYHAWGRLQFANGRTAAGLSNLHRAAVLEPGNAAFSFDLALALAEGGASSNACAWLEETVRRDPRLGRAWYNLGLAYASAERLPEAVRALRQAEALLLHSGDPAFARATVHLRLREPGAAVEALRAALQAEPGHAAANQLLRQQGAR